MLANQAVRYVKAAKRTRLCDGTRTLKTIHVCTRVTSKHTPETAEHITPLWVIHGDIAAIYFSLLVLVGIFAWAVTFQVCAFVRHFFLGIYAQSCFIGFCLMQVAPKQFFGLVAGLISTFSEQP